MLPHSAFSSSFQHRQEIPSFRILQVSSSSATSISTVLAAQISYIMDARMRRFSPRRGPLWGSIRFAPPELPRF